MRIERLPDRHAFFQLRRDPIHRRRLRRRSHFLRQQPQRPFDRKMSAAELGELLIERQEIVGPEHPPRGRLMRRFEGRNEQVKLPQLPRRRRDRVGVHRPGDRKAVGSLGLVSERLMIGGRHIAGR